MIYSRAKGTVPISKSLSHPSVVHRCARAAVTIAIIIVIIIRSAPTTAIIITGLLVKSLALILNIRYDIRWTVEGPVLFATAKTKMVTATLAI